MYGVCRNIDLGILLFNFSRKNYSSKAYTHVKKVVVLVTQRTTKLILPFLDFSTILYRFYKILLKLTNGVESICTQAPGTFESSQMCPRFPTPYPDGGGALALARWGLGRQTSGQGVRLALPSIDWWWRFGRGGHRRAAAVEQKQRGQGGSDDGEYRGGAQQCVARATSMCPREGARWVPGLGESAEGRARQWWSGGGRGSAGPDEQAVWLGQHARV
jgi:hypothetical protein